MDDMLGLQYWGTDIASNGKSIPLYFSLSSNDSAFATLVRSLLGKPIRVRCGCTALFRRRGLRLRTHNSSSAQILKVQRIGTCWLTPPARITASLVLKGRAGVRGLELPSPWTQDTPPTTLIPTPWSSYTISIEIFASSFPIETSYFRRIVLI